jgi:tetratricopeptide (TPR) repeat protein
MGTMTVAQAQPWKNNLLLLANAAKTAPRNIAAQILLGDELEARNNFAEAKICYELALELTPAWAPAWFAYGRTLLLTHDAEAAVQSLQRAIVLGDSPIIRVWLAVAFEATGRHAEAQSALTVAVAKDPGTLQAYADVRKRLQSSPAK